MKKSILALVLAMAMIAGLVGCGSSGGGKAEDSTQAAAPAAGGSDLKVMIETGVESLDPQVATDGTSFEFIANYTDGLMQMDSD